MLIFGCVDFPEIAGEFRKPPASYGPCIFSWWKLFCPPWRRSRWPSLTTVPGNNGGESPNTRLRDQWLGSFGSTNTPYYIYIDISYYTNIRWIHDKCMCMYIYLYVNIYIHMIFWCMRVLHVQRICAGCVAYRYTYTHIEKQIKDNHIRSYDIYYHDILQNIFPSAKEPSKNLALSKKSQPATKNDMFCICRCFRK